MLDKFPRDPSIAHGVLEACDANGGAAAGRGSYEIEIGSSSGSSTADDGLEAGVAESEREAIALVFCGGARRRGAERHGGGDLTIATNTPFPAPEAREYVLRRAARARGGR